MALFLADKLKDRIQILEAVETHNDDGGFDRSYTTLTTIWSSFNPISLKPRYIRGVQVEGTPTHEFIIRRSSVYNLGKGYTSGFSTGFDSVADLNPIKSDYYILVQRGSTIKGRLFRIHSVEDVKERRSHLRLFAEEYEEKATGYPV